MTLPFPSTVLLVPTLQELGSNLLVQQEERREVEKAARRLLEGLS